MRVAASWLHSLNGGSYLAPDALVDAAAGLGSAVSSYDWLRSAKSKTAPIAGSRLDAGGRSGDRTPDKRIKSNTVCFINTIY